MKKLLALALILALTLTLMLPALAAGTPSAEPNHTHNWVYVGAPHIDGYQMINVDQHFVYYHNDVICTVCAMIQCQTTPQYTRRENHTPPCYRCGCAVK